MAFLGVFFAVPLRRQVVEIDKLRFPTGTATAETILAMFSDAGEAVPKANVLVKAALFAGLFALTAYFIPQLESPPLYKWVEIGRSPQRSMGIQIVPGSFPVRGRFSDSPRVSFSLLLGAVVAWAILGPWAQSAGW